jgi:hypothetical protein
MKPIDQNAAHGACQVLLTVLSDEKGSTPNNLLEGVVSGKSLLRAIIGGQLVLCEPGHPAQPKDAEPENPEDEGDVDPGEGGGEAE